MNYIKEAEKYLRHYRDLQHSIDYMNKKISKLTWEGLPDGYKKNITIDDMPHGSKFKDEMYNIAFELKTFQRMKEETEKELKEMDSILNKLAKEDSNYEKVLRYWYIEKKPKEEIAELIHYSSRTTIYEIKGKAIRKFAVMIFGLDALSAS